MATIRRRTLFSRATETICEASASRENSLSNWPLHPTTSMPRSDLSSRPRISRVRAIARTQHVDPLAEKRLLHQPGVRPAPREQRQGQKNKPFESRKVRAREEPKQQAQHACDQRNDEQHPPRLVHFDPDLRGIVKIESVRKQQDDDGQTPESSDFRFASGREFRVLRHQ